MLGSEGLILKVCTTRSDPSETRVNTAGARVWGAGAGAGAARSDLWSYPNENERKRKRQPLPNKTVSGEEGYETNLSVLWRLSSWRELFLPASSPLESGSRLPCLDLSLSSLDLCFLLCSLSLRASPRAGSGLSV